MRPFVAPFAIVIIALTSGARAHAAVAPDVTSSSAPASQPEGGPRYAAQLVVASLAFVPLTIWAASSDDPDLTRGTLAASFIGLPAAVHAAHGRWPLALGSGALRSAALAIPFLYAQSVECHGGPVALACEVDAGVNTAALFLGATLVATIADFALYAHDTGRPRAPEPRARPRIGLTPTVAALPGAGVQAGLAGTF